MDVGTESGRGAGGPSHRYACFGLEVLSEMPLPELAGVPASPSTSTSPVVVVRRLGMGPFLVAQMRRF